MRLRVIGRQDPFLFAGLVFALIVVFQRSIFNIFDAATDVERIYGVSLRPALLILTVMFVFHQVRAASGDEGGSRSRRDGSQAGARPY